MIRLMRVKAPKTLLSGFSLCAAILGPVHLGHAEERIAEAVHWESPGVLLSILLPEVSSDFVGSCVADVMRPGQAEEPLASSGNKLRCESLDPNDGFVREWSFGHESPVSFWGNRFDIKPNFSVTGPFAKFLFNNLRDGYQTGRFPGIISQTALCGPGGQICTEMYALKRDQTSEGPAALFCSADSENGQVYSVDCVFLL